MINNKRDDWMHRVICFAGAERTMLNELEIQNGGCWDRTVRYAG